MVEHKQKSSKPQRLPPVSIPLPFEKALEGLLAIDPQDPIEQAKREKKKPRPKK